MDYVRIAELAHEALEHFVFDQQHDMWTLRPDTPEWVTDLVFYAHDGALPNDWKFRFVYIALTNLENVRSETEWEEADLFPSETWNELLDWLRDDPHAVSYADDVLQEFGSEVSTLFQLLQFAQSEEMRDVYELVTGFLWAKAEKEVPA
jgi:hypothetical protein